MNQNAEYWRGEPFPLPLTLKVGEPLWVMVREVEPSSRILLDIYGFTPRSDQPSETPRIVSLQSPPILPFYDGQKDQQAFNDIRMSVLTWCDSMSVPTDDTDLDWGWILFQKDHEDSERHLFYQILAQVHGLTPGSQESELLRTLLRLLFFNYVMSTAFLVPDDKIEPLYKRLIDPGFHARQLIEGELVCPRAVNKFLKMLLLPVLKELTQNALTGIESVITSRTKHKPELTISLTFLMLTIAGRTEDSISQIMLATTGLGESSLNQKDAEESIFALDWGLSDVVIELNTYALQSRFKLRDDQLKQENPLMKSFSSILEDLGR